MSFTKNDKKGRKIKVTKFKVYKKITANKEKNKQ